MLTVTALRALGSRRASRRWSDLLHKRIGHLMKAVLGDCAWARFVAHANEMHKPAFLAAFDAPALRCEGMRDGLPCPRAFVVNMRCGSAYARLGRLHLDHEQDVRVTCDMWRRAHPAGADWFDGVDAFLLCHLLFDVSGGALRFRCGPSQPWEAAGSYCHDLRLPHYENTRSIALP